MLYKLDFVIRAQGKKDNQEKDDVKDTDFNHAYNYTDVLKRKSPLSFIG